MRELHDSWNSKCIRLRIAIRNDSAVWVVWLNAPNNSRPITPTDLSTRLSCAKHFLGEDSWPRNFSPVFFLLNVMANIMPHITLKNNLNHSKLICFLFFFRSSFAHHYITSSNCCHFADLLNLSLLIPSLLNLSPLIVQSYHSTIHSSAARSGQHQSDQST